MSSKSSLFIIGLVVILSGSYFVWPGPQMRAETAERLRKEAEVRSKQQQEREKAEAQQRSEERKWREAITRGASDAELLGLISGCKRQIEESITKGSSSFAVYFPKYSSRELEEIYAMSVAMRTKMGRPSSIAKEKDIDAENINSLRKYPSLPLEIVVESASDSFSGVKQWAANYKCNIEGVKIERIAMGKRYFFE